MKGEHENFEERRLQKYAIVLIKFESVRKKKINAKFSIESERNLMNNTKAAVEIIKRYEMHSTSFPRYVLADSIFLALISHSYYFE